MQLDRELRGGRRSPKGAPGSSPRLTIAAAEGAIVVSRARRDIEPFDRVRAELIGLLERERNETKTHP